MRRLRAWLLRWTLRQLRDRHGVEVVSAPRWQSKPTLDEVRMELQLLYARLAEAERTINILMGGQR